MTTVSQIRAILVKSNKTKKNFLTKLDILLASYITKY